MSKTQITPVTAIMDKKNGSTSENKNKTSKADKVSKEKSNTLDNLFEEGLKDIYSAEKQLIEALPKMARASYSEDLKDAFTQHLEETKFQAQRLEKIFTRLRIDKTEKKKCEAMAGLIEEGKQIIENFEEGPVRDSALIIGAQKVEHYEIATYGSLCELADVLGYGKIRDILGQSLEEEETTDHTLSDIAQPVNDEAYEISCEQAV
jgi:ferritin-like metal-binding protein YciE